MPLRLIAFILCLAFIPCPTWANQPLIFRDEARGVRETELLEYLASIKKFDSALPYRISATDLNGDGVEEWIVFQITSKTCESNMDCAFVIGGLSEGEPALLGEMRGGKIAISDEKLYGIHKLLVYNEKNNDFAYRTYIWLPPENAFRPE